MSGLAIGGTDCKHVDAPQRVGALQCVTDCKRLTEMVGHSGIKTLKIIVEVPWLEVKKSVTSNTNYRVFALREFRKDDVIGWADCQRRSNSC